MVRGGAHRFDRGLGDLQVREAFQVLQVRQHIRLELGAGRQGLLLGTQVFREGQHLLKQEYHMAYVASVLHLPEKSSGCENHPYLRAGCCVNAQGTVF